MLCFEKHSGKEYRITTLANGPAAAAGAILVKTMGPEVARYWTHPEPKSCDAGGEPWGPLTSGLLRRRPVFAERVLYTGKESNKQEEVELRLVTDLKDVGGCEPGQSPARPQITWGRALDSCGYVS
jgi:hypothetical protein